MRFRQTRSDLIVAVVIAATALLLGAGTYWIATSTVDRMVRKDAETAAFGWANYLSENLSDIASIAAGAEPSAESLAFIESAESVGQVFRFKLFDPEGRLRLVSDEIGKTWDNEPSLKAHNPPAAAVTVTRAAHTEVKRGTPPKRPPLYARPTSRSSWTGASSPSPRSTSTRPRRKRSSTSSSRGRRWRWSA